YSEDIQGYERKSNALDKLLFNNDALFNPRNFAKYPLMIFLYGAGIAKISYSVAKANIIKEVVLPAIGTMQAEYNSLDAKAQANYINNTVLPFQENIQAFSAKPKDFLLAKNIRLNTAPQMDIHTEHLAIEMGKVLEPRINYALNKVLSETKLIRARVLEAIGIIQDKFLEELNKEEAKWLEGKSLTTVPDAIRAMIIKDKLIKLLPQYTGPLMDKDAGEFLSLVSTVRVETKDSFATSSYITQTEDGEQFTRTARGYKTEFKETAPFALVRMIQMMDAAILYETLDKHPNALPLFDAVITDPKTAERASGTYGRAYVKFGREFSIGMDLITTALKIGPTNSELVNARIGLSRALGRLHNEIDEKGIISKQLNLTVAKQSEDDIQNAFVNAVGRLHTQDKPKQSDTQNSAMQDTFDLAKQKKTKQSKPTVINKDTNKQKKKKSKQNNPDQYAFDFDNPRDDIQYAVDLENIVKEERLDSLNLKRDKGEFLSSLRVTQQSMNTLFNNFTSKSESYYSTTEAFNEHTTTLSNVLNTVSKGINNLGNLHLSIFNIEGITQGTYIAAKERINLYMSKHPPQSVNGQSTQEVYVHEMVHAVAKRVLETTPKLKARLLRLQKLSKQLVDKDGGYKVFLGDIVNP
ncbi:MAG: hypothetical protein U9O94_09340, partial [Nanoarchaeota archaeon]|nr:hypothetical protein [Nanoarchaeota archaeon]